jgi:hypothetical protein
VYAGSGSASLDEAALVWECNASPDSQLAGSELLVSLPQSSVTEREVIAKITDVDHFTKRFNISDTAVVLIDHQKGTCGWVHSIDAAVLEKNVRILATFATKTKMPLVLTSSM